MLGIRKQIIFILTKTQISYIIPRKVFVIPIIHYILTYGYIISYTICMYIYEFKCLEYINKDISFRSC